MNSKGQLLVLIGPSGSGKSTVLQEVLRITPNTFLSVSATTRSPRKGEEYGKNYFFVSQTKFQQLIQSDGLLEYANYVGNFYGTPKETVLQQLNKGENVILEIEVQGAKQIRKIYPEAVLIFILPPSLSELRKRLTERKTEDESAINARLCKAIEEIRFAYECNYIVINDKVETAADMIRSIILSISCKKNQMKSVIDRVLQDEQLI